MRLLIHHKCHIKILLPTGSSIRAMATGLHLVRLFRKTFGFTAFSDACGPIAQNRLYFTSLDEISIPRFCGELSDPLGEAFGPRPPAHPRGRFYFSIPKWCFPNPQPYFLQSMVAFRLSFIPGCRNSPQCLSDSDSGPFSALPNISLRFCVSLSLSAFVCELAQWAALATCCSRKFRFTFFSLAVALRLRV